MTSLAQTPFLAFPLADVAMTTRLPSVGLIERLLNGSSVEGGAVGQGNSLEALRSHFGAIHVYFISPPPPPCSRNEG